MKTGVSTIRCQRTWRRHRWQVREGKAICKRCGDGRNPKAGGLKKRVRVLG